MSTLATRLCCPSFCMLKNKAKKISKDKNREFPSSMLNSLKTLRKTHRLKLKRTFRRLSATSKLRTRDSRTSKISRRRKKLTSRPKFNKLSKKMKFTPSSCRTKAWLRKSTQSANLKNKRKSRCLKQRLSYLKNHLGKSYPTSKRNANS